MQNIRALIPPSSISPLSPLHSGKLKHKTRIKKSPIPDWESVEKRINDFFDELNIKMGDPVSKQEQFFLGEKLKVVNLRKKQCNNNRKFTLDLTQTKKNINVKRSSMNDKSNLA